MVVRFPCGACGQPIEVDEEWASKAVACPYCRKTVIAPAESTLGDLAAIPVASPLAASEANVPPRTRIAFDQMGAPARGFAPHSVNRLALVALVLVGCSVVSLIVAMVIVAPHRAEVEELQKTTSAAESFAKMMEAQTAFLKANPQALQWLIPWSVLAIVAVLTGLAAIVCALFALRRPYRRGWAVAALLIAGAVPMFLCCGGAALGAMR